MMSGAVQAVLLTGGLVIGLAALAAAVRRCGREGISGKALAWAAISGLFILALPCVGLALLWGALLRGAPTNTYDHNGVRFSYSSEWEVAEEPEIARREGTPRITRDIRVDRVDKAATICITFFPFRPGVVNPSLESYARGLVSASTGMTEAPLEPIAGNIGGVNKAGLRCQVTRRNKDGSVKPAEEDFFTVQAPKCQVIINTLTRENRRGAQTGMEGILRSLWIEGVTAESAVSKGVPEGPNVKMILYQPNGGSALIGNRTVMAGDLIEGFEIIAIEKDSVVVQSSAGVKRSLRIGDSLR